MKNVGGLKESYKADFKKHEKDSWKLTMIMELQIVDGECLSSPFLKSRKDMKKLGIILKVEDNKA